MLIHRSVEGSSLVGHMHQDPDVVLLGRCDVACGCAVTGTISVGDVSKNKCLTTRTSKSEPVHGLEILSGRRG